MDRVLHFILHHRILVCSIFLVLVVASLVMIPLVQVNYDLAEYLPEESTTKQAITVLEEEFSYPGTASVMVEDVSLREAADLKTKIEGVENVSAVLWLDSVADISKPLEFIDQSYLDSYYKDGAALYTVQFTEGSYSPKSGAALEEIRTLTDKPLYITGAAEENRNMNSVMNREITTIVLVVIPLCILILMLASSTWIEPFILLFVIGVSIVINMGTNLFFGEVSFITHGMASILQLAMSMDYSLFLMHRYLEERKKTDSVYDAVVTATKASISSIAASSLTTVAGFLALVFMQYSIGTDLGLVLAKGIVISFLSVIILTPIIILTMHKVIEKSAHRQLMPQFGKLGRGVLKSRWIILGVVLVLLVPCFLAQNSNSFLYGDSSGSSAQGEVAVAKQKVEDRFGVSNPVILLVPNDSVAKETQLANELSDMNAVGSVQALATMADPAIPRDMMPQAVRDMFISEDYSRMIVSLNIEGESDAVFAAVEDIKAAAQRYYPDQWLAAGTPTSVLDIKDTVSQDIMVVNLFSILAVGLIILLIQRSLSIPIILIFAIEASIWINMSVPYFSGSKLLFIGYLVVSSLQLGATIDYAILLTTRYTEFRRIQPPREAAVSAIKTAGPSVVISALILATAGFSYGLVSQIGSISEIGTLLGRGAALSGVLVLTLLPILLTLLDPVIRVTTLGTKHFFKAPSPQKQSKTNKKTP